MKLLSQTLLFGTALAIGWFSRRLVEEVQKRKGT